MGVFLNLNYSQLEKVIPMITSPELQRQLLPAQLGFTFFGLVFLAGIIYFYINSSYLRVNVWYDLVEFFAWSPYGALGSQRSWKKVRSRLEAGSESEYKLAVIEADDFLNEVLERRGYKGDNFEERINQISSAQLPNKEQVIDIHEVRNSVVYDPDFELELERAQEIIDVYQSTLRQLGAI